MYKIIILATVVIICSSTITKGTMEFKSFQCPKDIDLPKTNCSYNPCEYSNVIADETTLNWTTKIKSITCWYEEDNHTDTLNCPQVNFKVDSMAYPQSFSNVSVDLKCTAGTNDFTCADPSDNDTCNLTIEVTSGSILGVLPS